MLAKRLITHIFQKQKKKNKLNAILQQAYNGIKRLRPPRPPSEQHTQQVRYKLYDRFSVRKGATRAVLDAQQLININGRSVFVAPYI